MFILQKEPCREAQVYLKVLQKKMGQLPPHFEFFATVNFKRFKMFIEELNYITNHPAIDKDFFTFIRYYIASTNNFSYCIKLNSKLLLSSGYSKENLKNVIEKKSLPLDSKFTTLFQKAIKAIEKPHLFCKDDLQELYKLGFSDNDIWDAIDHASFLFKYYKILSAYRDSDECS